MADIAYNIVSFVVAIAVLIAIHEYGHFWVARKLGFKVLRYSIGFGKPLWRRRSRHPDQTEYWISAIPLGGYVKLLDEREGPVDPAEAHRAFNRRPIPARIAVLLAGPGANFLFAVFAYWIVFAAGIPGLKPVVGSVIPDTPAAEAGLVPGDEIRQVNGIEVSTWQSTVLAVLDEVLEDGQIRLSVASETGRQREVDLDLRGRSRELTEPDALLPGIGIAPPAVPAYVGEVVSGGPGEQGGLRAGDEVLAINGVPVEGWSDWVARVRERPGERITLDVRRAEAVATLEVVLESETRDGEIVGRIGAGRDTERVRAAVADLRTIQQLGPLPALSRAANETWSMTRRTVKMLGRMLVGDVSIKNLSGPINIASFAGDSAQAGWRFFVSFLAVISISLGVINLAPIPMLDGGQIVYQLIEAGKGSPLSERALLLGQQVGLVLLLIIMSFAFYNDLARVFG